VQFFLNCGKLLWPFFQIKDRRFVGGAILAAQRGVGHGAETLAAPAFNLNFLFEAKELFDHFAVEFEGIGLVGA
jgi:hypothetical protein